MVLIRPCCSTFLSMNYISLFEISKHFHRAYNNSSVQPIIKKINFFTYKSQNTHEQRMKRLKNIQKRPTSCFYIRLHALDIIVTDLNTLKKNNFLLSAPLHIK